jgi:uncharacterized integral membrane protein (TIGR00697 family)
MIDYKRENKLQWLNVIFVVSLIVTNVTAMICQDTGISILGVDVLLPAANITFIITCLITDVVSELYGKEEAVKMTKRGFIAQIYATIMITATTMLPSVDKALGDAYDLIFGLNFMMVIGSLAAYYVGQQCDIKIYHFLRGIFTKDNQRWIQKNVSTVISQLVDTTIISIIGYGIGLGWLWQDNSLKLIVGVIIGQYIVKILLAALDTPLFYLLTKRKCAN